ncbi:MAG: hypothetical protein M1431_08650 [Candidatus Thermoplasmatota archaeon]|nr:hypothetical protein [Candidatus Thermoplasmatota archaeon]
MSMLSDFEVINSALIYGEPLVAVKLIERKTRELNNLKRMTGDPKRKYDSHISLLELYGSAIRCDITLDEFSEKLEKIPNLKDTLEVENLDFAIASISYYLRLALDRYNIRYPEYDSKRCDDR